MKVRDHFENYLQNKALCPLTIRGYLRDADQFIAWVDDHDMSLPDFSKEDAQNYVSYLMTHEQEVRPGKMEIYSSSTVRKKVSVMRSLFESLRESHE